MNEWTSGFGMGCKMFKRVSRIPIKGRIFQQLRAGPQLLELVSQTCYEDIEPLNRKNHSNWVISDREIKRATEPLFTMTTQRLDQTVHLEGENTFESWDRSFKTTVEDQGLTDEVFKGKAMITAPTYPEPPPRPERPRRTNSDELPPAEGTQQSVALDQSYEMRLKEWEIDIKEWQAEMTEYSADERK
ncbi:hypothetical protein ACJ73_02017 [Blastomyces percursus]|uniref:Uncharacterized protein n=1 Tax=Blastomyces percursus TaxID=1658174 RepID=A0A1J9QDJ3_9EURO|nr:hypothetical protein ACJ73_02017 [Blastomyces percursus]